MNRFFNLFIALGFLTLNTPSYAVKFLTLDSIITLPDAETLKQHIATVVSPKFLKKTGLLEELTSSPKSILEIALKANEI